MNDKYVKKTISVNDAKWKMMMSKKIMEGLTVTQVIERMLDMYITSTEEKDNVPQGDMFG